MLDECNGAEYRDSVMARRVTGELVGLTEIAERFGVARNSAWRWSRRPDFPEPVARLTAGTVWNAADIDTWARETLPLPGTRPDRKAKR